MIGKLMSLASLGSSFASIKLVQKFLSGVASVIALTVVSAILVGFVLASAFIGAYFALTYFGLDPIAAGVLVVATVLLLVGGLVYLTVQKIEELRQLPTKALDFDVPSFGKITHIVEAFIEGLMTPRPKPPVTRYNNVKEYPPRRRRG